MFPQLRTLGMCLGRDCQSCPAALARLHRKGVDRNRNRNLEPGGRQQIHNVTKTFRDSTSIEPHNYRRSLNVLYQGTDRCAFHSVVRQAVSLPPLPPYHDITWHSMSCCFASMTFLAYAG
jgi:hypothetical protein